ncbi:aldehyde dehydrogenase family protein [bacterium]|nr:MAG: aldehyde dehydrogenase family protein [bacterium]
MVHHGELLIDGHFVGGPCDQATAKEVIKAPWDGSVVGVAAEGGFPELRGCVDAAAAAFDTWRFSPRHQRQKLLRRIAQLVRERSEELARLLCREVGKPITMARGEVARLAVTFDIAADLLATWGLEARPADLDTRGENVRIAVERVPQGVIFGIVPYNWPFNLAAHKLAPALASGNTVVLKASPLAPLCTLELGRIVHEAGCPPGVLNVWNGPTADVERVLDDPRIAMLSFTGSEKVGWRLKQRLWDRPVTLELGGDAMAIVMPDADLDRAAKLIALSGYGYAGQVCISTQHVLVQRLVYDDFRERLAEETRNCPTGDPEDDATVCGPLITPEAAEKTQRMIDASGGTLVAGGGREGALLRPTLLENVALTTELATEEAFAPVLTLSPFEEFDQAAKRVNGSRFGIHAAVFTKDLTIAEAAFRTLNVGGVVINDSPSLRFDVMPYGGVRRSGFGREGVREAMDEMTTPKTMVVRT